MKEHMKKKSIVNLCMLAVVILISLLFRGQSYIFTVVNFILIYIIAASGLDILFGYSGQISLGHAGFYAIGAYTSALLSRDLGVPVLLAMIVSGIVAILVAMLLAYPASKLTYHFLSLVTIAFGEIMYLLIVNSPGDITSGFTGLYGIPPLSLFGMEFKSSMSYFYVLLLFAVLFLFIKSRIVNSKIGRSFIAIRDNSFAANGMGINVRRQRVMAFAISAFYTAFAGALYAHMIRFISPEVFTLDIISVPLLTMVLFGGLSSQWGPVIGAVVVTIINELLQVTGEYRMIIYGAFVVVVLLFMPKGIMSFINGLISKIVRGRGGEGQC